MVDSGYQGLLVSMTSLAVGCICSPTYTAGQVRARGCAGHQVGKRRRRASWVALGVSTLSRRDARTRTWCGPSRWVGAEPSAKAPPTAKEARRLGRVALELKFRDRKIQNSLRNGEAFYFREWSEGWGLFPGAVSFPAWIEQRSKEGNSRTQETGKLEPSYWWFQVSGWGTFTRPWGVDEGLLLKSEADKPTC